eukprot:c29333_g1_i4 orf=454-2049(-)
MRLEVLIVLFHLFVTLSNSSEQGNDEDYRRCEMNLRTWVRQTLQDLAQVAEEDDGKLKDLLFFLHIPRTGGRNLQHCVIRPSFSTLPRCPSSYVQFRYNASAQCSLLTSHHDYSAMTKLPKQMTSVMTTIRHPIDRVFSVYEFSVEVAARHFKTWDAKAHSTSSSTSAQSLKGQSTLKIWPWSYLVPWMWQDLMSRHTKKQAGTTAPLIAVDPYDFPSTVIPLHEFIHQPIVADLVHNGATFQVAGLTNLSYLTEAGDLRNCVLKYPDLGHYILDVAKERLSRMLYVGLAERQKDTAALFAHVIGEQAFAKSLSMDISSVLPTPAVYVQDPKNLEGLHLVDLSEKGTTGSDALTEQSKEHWRNSTAWNISTVEDLMAQYDVCWKRALKKHVSVRYRSMKHIPSVNFSKEARNKVPDAILAAILQLNSLDVELHRHAQILFSKQELYNQSTPQEWIQRRWHAQWLNGKSMKNISFADLLVHDRISWGSRRTGFLLSFSTVSMLVTIGLCWGVFVGRILKIRLGLYCNSHQKK